MMNHVCQDTHPVVMSPLKRTKSFELLPPNFADKVQTDKGLYSSLHLSLSVSPSLVSLLPSSTDIDSCGPLESGIESEAESVS